MLTKRKEISRKNQIQDNETPTLCQPNELDSFLRNRNPNGRSIYKYDDHSAQLKVFNHDRERLNELQKKSLDIICSHLTSEDPSAQLQMFLTGEGGTGKSEVIKLAVNFSRLYFGRQKGMFGPVVATAQSGTAAKNIDGYTWHSVVNKGNGEGNISHETAKKVGKKLQGVKFLIIDEISLTSCSDLWIIHERIVAGLKTLVNKNDHEAQPNKKQAFRWSSRSHLWRPLSAYIGFGNTFIY
jgi:hypothetical protein